MAVKNVKGFYQERGDNNVIIGSTGNDYLYVYGHHNVLNAGAGGDTMFDSGGHHNALYGEEGNDRLNASSSYNDTLDGGVGDDNVYTSFGHDNLINGGDGKDSLTLAYESNDTVLGGAGDDLLWVVNARSVDAGPAHFSLTGGDGNDVFEFTGNVTSAVSGVVGRVESTVTDFNVAQDSLYVANASNQHFTHDQLNAAFVDGNTIISYNDVNASGVVTGTHSITLVGIDQSEWAQVHVA